MSAMPPALTVVVLTRDEEKNLPGLLESLQRINPCILVVDSGSSDGTAQIARAAGATVLHHPFETHARQWQWALAQLPPTIPWVLGLDADQRLTPEACRSILDLTGRESGIAGAYLARRQVFRGRWIRFGGYYPKYLLKLFRRDRVCIDDRDLVDHHFRVSGPTVILEGDLIEANANENDLSEWIEKHNRYAQLQAREEFAYASGGRLPDPQKWFGGTPDERTSWLKTRWRKTPLYIRPALYFFYRYFVRLGFLDGKQGFIFHFLQGFWYRLLVDIYLDELRSASGR